ncbi:ROK family protein [Flexithrix dorotheae]|uniref:ROK family protein n=1 Tax=Flexithrix dorotheae TaxID=70993 RepID=UPI000382F080|nr:ROK family protein [Flexithrix dorotheae]
MKIGADLGGTNFRACLINDQQIIKSNKIPLENKESFDSTIEQIINLIKTINGKDVAGIGIGVPSVVDTEKGIVYDVVNIPSWKEVLLKDILENEFHIPVYINNDVNCFVLGEKYFGVGKNYKNIVGITIGTGIGAGIILDNKLYSGTNCGAGEFGYFPYLNHDLEYYCSSNFFDKEYGTTAYNLFLKAEKNDAQALSVWNEFGHHLGIALKSVMYAYDPEIIILGGSISSAFKFFEASMLSALKDNHFPKSIERLKICVSQIDNVSMLGAASLVDQPN